jgi:hypothetical protein
MSKRSGYFDWEEVKMYEERFSRVESRKKVGIDGSGNDLSTSDVLYHIIQKADPSLEGSEEARKLADIP